MVVMGSEHGVWLWRLALGIWIIQYITTTNQEVEKKKMIVNLLLEVSWNCMAFFSELIFLF